MSNIDGPLAPSTAAASTAPSTTSSSSSAAASSAGGGGVASTVNLGFCHSCNRQNVVNTTNYTCSVCNGGFIELLTSVSETT